LFESYGKRFSVRSDHYEYDDASFRKAKRALYDEFPIYGNKWKVRMGKLAVGHGIQLSDDTGAVCKIWRTK
jgi:hypothetical protein